MNRVECRVFIMFVNFLPGLTRIFVSNMEDGLIFEEHARSDMEECPLFSHICGENVRVSEGRSETSWDPRYSGGIVFSEQPLCHRERIRVELEGSSHVDIGVTQVNPNSLRGPELVRKLYLSDKCDIINNIRVHRKKCEVLITNLQDKVVSPSGTKTFGVSVDPKKDVWLVVCIKFGNASVTIDSPAVFHEVTGENIEFEGTNKQRAKLKVVNPSAICILEKAITAKDYKPVTIGIDPILGNDRNPPHIYHVRLGVTSVRPDELAASDPQALSISKPSTRRSQTRWMPVQTFERRNTGDVSNVINTCTGTLTIEVNADGELYYSHSSGTEGTWTMKGAPLYIVLELFRVSIKVLQPLQRTGSGYAVYKKGYNAYPLVDPKHENSTFDSRSANQQSDKDDRSNEYISPVLSNTPESTASPCESSWHDWSTSGYTSWVLRCLSSLETEATEEPVDSFERKMTDTIKEMKKMKLKDDGYMEMNQVTNEEPTSTTPPASITPPRSEEILRQIYTKMEHLEDIILKLKNVEKNHHDKMYASYKALKKAVEGITNPTADMVSMETILQVNYTDLLHELDPRDLIFKLYQKGIINLSEKQTIVEMRENGRSKTELNDKLLYFLGLRPVNRAEMIEALEYSNQAHLKDKILPEKST
ncbi:uncharacterized protein LOC117315081 [Pecten maximus]|uniref:uncharacterized protein LOC117315081 n=1 Tax=Pecten maximus TaxID=6579 RepID=UPI00145847B7|nr:uncharacterized protein LOC117315081 [Pecten maximus]